jgi:hypothetical protein
MPQHGLDRALTEQPSPRYSRLGWSSPVLLREQSGIPFQFLPQPLANSAQENRPSGNPDQPVERVARLARAEVRRARAVQCPIGYLVDSAFEESVISAEHAGWPKPLVLTPFVMS